MTSSNDGRLQHMGYQESKNQSDDQAQQNERKLRTIGIVSSRGGHLTEALSLIEVFKGHEVFLIVHDYPNLKDTEFEGIRRVYRLPLVWHYSIWKGVLMTNFLDLFRLMKIFWIERPSVLFSTGAEIAVPAFYVGKLFFRTKLIFLESMARVKDFSLTGKVVYPIADLFLVQWPELVRPDKRRAVYRGRLL